MRRAPSRRSAEQAHAEENANRLEAVPPRDLLPLCVGAAVVGNRQLVHAELALADLRRDLRLDCEVALTQVERAKDLRAEGLVARLHVRERRVVEHVRQQREKPIPDEVPEEVRTLRPPAGEARAEDD